MGCLSARKRRTRNSCCSSGALRSVRYPKNSRRAAESIIPPDGRSLGNGSLIAAGPLIQAERVPDAENEIRCTVIEPQSNVEIDLLRRRKAIRAAGIDKLSRAGIVRIVADVLRKKIAGTCYRSVETEYRPQPQRPSRYPLTHSPLSQNGGNHDEASIARLCP
jgi:hypothetical protein